MKAGQTEQPAWVWLARIRKTQGRKGEVLAEILTDFPEKFAERKRVWLLPTTAEADPGPFGPAREVELRSHWLNKAQAGGVVLHFAGVDSIASAEALRDLVVAIPREQRTLLGQDEVYVGDLIGCTLLDVTPHPPRVVGVIEDVDREAGPVALLVLKATGGEEILVPFAKAYLRQIDCEAGRLEMALPEGLVEVQLSTDPKSGVQQSGQQDSGHQSEGTDAV